VSDCSVTAVDSVECFVLDRRRIEREFAAILPVREPVLHCVVLWGVFVTCCLVVLISRSWWWMVLVSPVGKCYRLHQRLRLLHLPQWLPLQDFAWSRTFGLATCNTWPSSALARLAECL
jgi:hypothetical protein